MASIRDWLVISLASWLIIGFLGTFWHPMRIQSATAIYFALAVGCFANWFKNRTLHCAITGPIFIVLGSLSLLSELGFLRTPDRLSWLTLLFGIPAAFLSEWQIARRK